MKNLFKKLLPESKNAKYPKEVYEIHHEFSIAADKLLLEAKSVINEVSQKYFTKIDRLEALGFKQVKQVSEAKPLIEKAKLSKEQIELLSYYQVKYPNNKFITESQVKEICYKWNLVCADVSRFKGFVPEKNLREIENFKLKKEDKTVTGTLWGIGGIGGNTKEEYTITEAAWNSVGDQRRGESLGNMNEDQNWCKSEHIGRSDHKYFDTVSYSKLKICAPVKDMDLRGVKIEKGYKVVEKFVPDPVVLQPVNGGYLILTAWGDEASDENVVNQKMN